MTPTSSRPHPNSRRPAAPLLMLVLGLVAMACSPEPPPASTTPILDGVLDDGSLLAGRRPVYDLGAGAAAASEIIERPHFRPEDPGHTELLGKGWGVPEVHGRTGDHFVWAMATRVSASLELLDAEQRTFFIRCWPYRFDGAPDQTLTVTINEVPLGTITLSRRLRTYELTIPAGTLFPGRNVVHLEFAYADSPAAHIEGREDDRLLAAAVVLMGVGDADEHPVESTTRPSARPTDAGWLLHVPAGTALAYSLAVPPAAVLDLGWSCDGAAGQTHGEVWVRPHGKPAVTVFTTEQFADSHTRWQVDLGRFAGQEVTIGLASRVHGSAPAGGIDWLEPKVYTSDADLDGTSNVVLIVVDTLRADHLSCYGGRTATPNMDALARSGVRFSRTSSHIPITGPSHSSIFTSELPAEHGVHNNTQILAKNKVTLAELLHAHARRTAAFVSLGVLKEHFGLAQGFDEYHDRFGRDWFKTASEVNQEVIPWLEQAGSGPFFLWVHYSDPHEPYAPPGLAYPELDVFLGDTEVTRVAAAGRTVAIGLRLQPGRNEVRFEAVAPPLARPVRFRSWRVKGARCSIAPGTGMITFGAQSGRPTCETTLPASVVLTLAADQPRDVTFEVLLVEKLSVEDTAAYYALEVESVDREIGRLVHTLTELGLRQRTLVILTADHGESLGEHGHIGHISQLYEPLVHVPLALSYPGTLAAGLRVDHQVSHIDLYPTVCELLGIPTPQGLRGRSLMPLIIGTGDAPRPVMVETYRPESPFDRQALIADGFKYIFTSQDERRELYDLGRDPEELINLAGSKPEQVHSLHERLVAGLAAVRSGEQASAAELTEEDRSQLEALGYVH